MQSVAQSAWPSCGEVASSGAVFTSLLRQAEMEIWNPHNTSILDILILLPFLSAYVSYSITKYQKKKIKQYNENSSRVLNRISNVKPQSPCESAFVSSAKIQIHSDELLANTYHSGRECCSMNTDHAHVASFKTKQKKTTQHWK